MKTKFAFILLVAASLAACTTTVKTTQSSDDKSKGSLYAATSLETNALDERLQNDIPAEGPAPGNLNDNPAYIPTPLLRQMAAGGP